MAQTYDSATRNIFAEPEKISVLFGDTAVGKSPSGPAATPKSSPGAPNLFGPEASPDKSPAAPNLFGPESSPPDASPDAPNLFRPSA
jgi:hypothetical protein